jgi:hypothetical protein
MHGGPAIGQYVATIIPLLLWQTTDESKETRRNTAFCLGMLCRQAPQECFPFLQQILLSLHPLFTAAETHSDVQDNACGAVARIILAFGGERVPLSQILSVFVPSLPIKDDMTERQVVQECMQYVSNSYPLLLQPYSDLLKKN